MLNSGSDGHRFDGNGGKDEENEGDLRAEDSEMRMDLTDDLLHMVGSLYNLHYILVFIIFCIVLSY